MAAAGRTLVGIGVSVAFIAILKITAVWFPPERFATMNGVTLWMSDGTTGQANLSGTLGDILFNAGTGGRLVEVTPAGDLVWEATFDAMGTFFKLSPVADFYHGF